MKHSDRYILALDLGTTSSRALLFNESAHVVGQAQHEFEQIFPKAGWVEHDPMEIWASQRSALTDVLERNSIIPEKIHAIGITNQRETTIIWNKKTGRPVYNAIVWQCRRTTSICQHLRSQNKAEMIREKTGLVLDPYFSASKIQWILDHVDGAREPADAGELLFGTVDTWLIWKLTKGASHVTDPTNASRTMLYNIHEQQWDEELLGLFNIPKSMLPKVKPSSSYMGHAQVGGKEIPIAGIAGDQQASLFGQQCFEPGSAKNTYGTGCFLLMNTGRKAVTSSHGLLTTLAIGPDCEINYALEGSVFMGGATIQWLRDELGFVQDEYDSAYFAQKVTSNEGVYLVPAFTGLGAPYWDPDAKGAIFGLTRGTNRNHIIRAALESIAYQSLDVLKAMQKDAKLNLKALHVDGGAIKNDFLMQFQSDMIEVDVILSHQAESSALGVACLAGLATDFWSSVHEIHDKLGDQAKFQPTLSKELQISYYTGWERAVQRTLSTLEADQPYPVSGF